MKKFLIITVCVLFALLSVGVFLMQRIIPVPGEVRIAAFSKTNESGWFTPPKSDNLLYRDRGYHITVSHSSDKAFRNIKGRIFDIEGTEVLKFSVTPDSTKTNWLHQEDVVNLIACQNVSLSPDQEYRILVDDIDSEGTVSIWAHQFNINQAQQVAASDR